MTSWPPTWKKYDVRDCKIVRGKGIQGEVAVRYARTSFSSSTACPPGWRAANLVISYTLASIMIHRFPSELCCRVHSSAACRETDGEAGTDGVSSSYATLEGMGRVLYLLDLFSGELLELLGRHGEGCGGVVAGRKAAAPGEVTVEPVTFQVQSPVTRQDSSVSFTLNSTC